PLVRPIQLTHRSDFKQAAISPDGSQLAIVAGDALVIRGVEPDSEERVVVDHGIADVALAWSPDGGHVLAGVVPDSAPLIPTELVGIEDGTRVKLPVPGMTAFLSSTELAVTSYRQRSVAIYPVSEHTTARATCAVPGDYAFIWALAGLPDGTMIVETLKETLKGETHNLVILRRDCSVRATFSAEPISSFGTTDTGTIAALIAGDGFGEIVEISLDGAVVSRRRISGAIDKIIGRRRGTDYVSTLALKTHLDRVHVGGPAMRQFTVGGSASFSLAPDGETLAWVDLGGRSSGRGRLRLSTLPHLSRRGRALLDNAVAVGWSPDGKSLAVLVEEAEDVAILVLDRSGTVQRRLPLRHLVRIAAPVWLSDHRIAAQADDRTTYRWFDLETGERGEVVDSSYGSTYWLARSPRDGMLAMWRNGPPEAPDTEHLWIELPGHPARPLHVAEAIRHYLVPSWSPSGELLVRALDTGQISRVALDTGQLTPIAQLPPTPMSRVFDDHLMALADGDLLAVDVDLGINVVAVAPDGESQPRPPDERGVDHL
ncbi:MAG TPA: WD40 repeat domain-containing protein, partial [Kofleriaceae bacterium]